MIGNLMPFKDKMIMEGFNRVRMATFRDAEFMSIVLTVTWLSVQTPTTCTLASNKTPSSESSAPGRRGP